MPKHLTRPALTALALFLFALSSTIAHAQDKPAPQTPRPEDAHVPYGVPAQETAPERAFRHNEVTKKALITFKPEPGFTEEALNNDVHGVVRLRAILHSSGKLTNLTIIRGLPDGLTEKAIDAARQIRFTPAEKDGRAVSQHVVLEYNFNIEDDGSLAKIIEQPQPEYTEEARRNRVAGKVVLTVYLRRDGTVDAPRVLEGLPHGLSEKAVEAALKVKFVPAEVRGRKVTVVRKLVYNFSPD